MTKEVTENASQDWDITAERYVGFIDIMGFKDLVARSSHEEIYDMMKKITAFKEFSEGVKWPKTNGFTTRSTFYSDSIMLYSKDDTLASLVHIITTLSSLSNDLITAGIPHKGALAFGKMTLDTVKSIYFGQPLIDAYLLQEEMHFYGIVIHATVQKIIEKNKFEHSLIFFEYMCPFKGGPSKHLTIPPLCCGPTGNNEERIRERNLLYDGFISLRHKTSGHLRRYIDNTEAFLNAFEDSP